MKKEDFNTLNHARITSYLSYLGIIIPPFGWIFGSISLVNIHLIDKSTLADKTRKTIKTIKKLAILAIILSTIVALTVSWFVLLRINEIKTKEAEAEQSCEEKVYDANGKIDYFTKSYDKNGEYYLPLKDSVYDTNPSDCKNNTSKTSSEIQNRLSAVQQICLSAASDKYNEYLDQNGTKTGTDSNGNAWYNMAQSKWDYVNKVLQDAKDNCNTIISK